jgi:hypothetical protein
MNSNLSGHQFAPIYRSDLTAGGAESGRAPQVSYNEFQNRAARGEQLINAARKKPAGTEGLDAHWDDVVQNAYENSRNEWGGGTYSGRGGKRLYDDSDAYALTARMGKQQSVQVPAIASREQFGEAMNKAREQFGGNFGEHATHLGVFHDADSGNIDIDPVMVVATQRKAEDAGAYTGATGGAYHFKSGDGYWPPSISDKAKVYKGLK